MRKDIRMSIKIWSTAEKDGYAAKKDTNLLFIEDKPIDEALEQMRDIMRKIR